MDNNQIVTSMIATFHKRESKCTSLTQLDTALGKWLKEASTDPKWTGPMILSLVQYRRFVIDTLGKSAPFSAVLRYHTLWTEAVFERTHNMFANDGHFYISALVEAGLWAFTHGPSSSSSSSRHGRKAHSPTSSTDRKEGEPSKRAVYSAGSCTNHPASTTHTTSQCQKK
jgi:hypothetical protein